MSDKNLAQAVLYDAGKAMYNDDELRTLSDAEVRKAGVRNIASFAGATALTIGVATAGYVGLHEKFEDHKTPANGVVSVDQSANSAPQPTTTESVEQVPAVATGVMPKSQATYTVTPPQS